MKNSKKKTNRISSVDTQGIPAKRKIKKTRDIVALGYCSIDHVCLIPEIPKDDKIEIRELHIGGGGPAATAVFAAARLGAKTAFLGAVGDDDDGQAILRELREEGIDTSGVMIRRNAMSPVAYCWVEQKSGRRSIAWSRGTI
ncbi:MAG: carbohydrate kinase family protein, partial [Clostridia bacterium]|nr:carbohydrate kinase family protein [Clostridia bacterium]